MDELLSSLTDALLDTLLCGVFVYLIASGVYVWLGALVKAAKWAANALGRGTKG